MTSHSHPAGIAALAESDLESVVELTSRLVRVPSRGGVDAYEPVLDVLGTWLADHHLVPQVLRDDTGQHVGVYGEIQGAADGPCWVLDACVDTAPFGDESSWRHPPTSAVVEDGWLWGRGTADSKAGAAIFAHIGARLLHQRDRLAGRVVLLFDADEHTGRFGGARTFFEGTAAGWDIGGVMIGYPGMDEIVVGSRGVHRCVLRVHGVASHSGASAHGLNAVVKASEVVGALDRIDLPPSTPGFPLGPKVSVTRIHGGESYTVTPDLCTLSVDVRTTPRFDADAVDKAIASAIDEVDDRWPDTARTEISNEMDWRPFLLAPMSPLRAAVLDAAGLHGLQPAPKVSGPSNIGNYLASHGIPATAGFGVNYHGLHAADERIEIATIPRVQAVYHSAVLRLLATASVAT